MVTIHSSGQTVFDFSHIEVVTLGAGEEVDVVAAGASSIGVNRLVEVTGLSSSTLTTSSLPITTSV